MCIVSRATSVEFEFDIVLRARKISLVSRVVNTSFSLGDGQMCLSFQ
jgi:hypothetical protein